MTLAWWAVVGAFLTATLIRFDAKAVGPYFAFYELMPGTGLTQALFQGEEKPLRLAVLRRFGYGFLLGIAVAWFLGGSVWDGALAGLLVGALLLWPLLFRGLPTWAAPARLLLVIYIAVVAVYAAVGALGYLFVSVVAEGDVILWVQKEGIQFLGSTLVAAFGLTALQLATRRR